jgi:hypothetical protein
MPEDRAKSHNAHQGERHMMGKEATALIATGTKGLHRRSFFLSATASRRQSG